MQFKEIGVSDFVIWYRVKNITWPILQNFIYRFRYKLYITLIYQNTKIVRKLSSLWMPINNSIISFKAFKFQNKALDNLSENYKLCPLEFVPIYDSRLNIIELGDSTSRQPAELFLYSWELNSNPTMRFWIRLQHINQTTFCSYLLSPSYESVVILLLTRKTV